MSDVLLGELLCISLLIITCGRIFFVHQKQIVTISILAPVSLLISVLLIITFGASVSEIVIFGLALFATIANIHAITRFINHLYIDYYTPLFFFFSLVLLLCSVFTAAMLIYLRPVQVRPGDFHSTEKKELMTGTLTGGFKEASTLSGMPDCILHTFSPDKQSGNLPIILFIPDIRADTDRYIPYLSSLAAQGYTVLSADFYTQDCRWFNSILDLPQLRRTALILQNRRFPASFNAARKEYVRKTVQEFDALTVIASERYGNRSHFIYITDGIGTSALTFTAQKYVYQTAGLLSLQNMDEYHTPGYGCIESTSPVLAYILFNLKRDKDMFYPRYMAFKTVKLLSPQRGSK